MNRRAAAGRDAEASARRHLERAGLRCRDTNYSCRRGELDLVMEGNDGELVFVEVRYRNRDDYGGAAGSIDARKRGRIIRAAAQYLAEQRLDTRPTRFDVVAIDGAHRIDWIVGAFDAGDCT